MLLSLFSFPYNNVPFVLSLQSTNLGPPWTFYSKSSMILYYLHGMQVWPYASLTMINVITPKKKQGHVVPEGYPGFRGIWPEYVAPNKDDSRCSCPALNTLANHGNVFFRVEDFPWQMTFLWRYITTWWEEHSIQRNGSSHTKYI